MPQLQRDSVLIDYAVHGPEAGEPLLLAMGLGMQRIAWPVSLLDAFARQGFRVITFDNRDIGLSTRYDQHGVPSLPRVIGARLIGRRAHTPYRLPDLADDGVALLDHLGVAHAHVLGISMGGMIAQHIAHRHAARVRSLTLMSTSSGRLGLPLPAPAVLKLMWSRPRSRVSVDAAIDYWVRLFGLIGSPAWPMSREDMERRARLSLQRAPTGAGVSRQLAALIADGDRSPLLRQLSLPTLVLHGTHDVMVPPAHGRQLASLIPGARLHTIHGWGHDLPDALSVEFARLVARHAVASAAGL
ncbi:MAG: alpha/beta hydrolase [Xanthomonadales bacterium]|nr:alpha/beta hydrolase [Xanthomonadales bacterium]MBK7144955.1 alpha/beta hydrolase [Xanthomonadales bacterium]MCC6562038.1 alpha/beta hydrolase [Xanthomonadales bacterium]